MQVPGAKPSDLKELKLAGPLIQLATSLVKTASQFWLGPFSGPVSDLADLASKRAEDALDQRRLQRILDDCVDTTTETLLKQISWPAYYTKPEEKAEVEAAILAAKEVFDVAQLDVNVVVATDADPAKLSKVIEPHIAAVEARAQLSPRAHKLFTLAVRNSCAYVAETAMSLASFSNHALTEILRRQTRIVEEVRTALTRMPRLHGSDTFETDYLRTVVRRLDRMELFGLARNVRRYPLTVSYITLNVIQRSADRPDFADQSASYRVEDAFAGSRSRYFLVVGEAGSGKTTLLRWLAVSAARASFNDSLARWNNAIPLMVPLRSYVDSPLPAPREMLDVIARNHAAEAPDGWVYSALTSGRALVLIDGVDELPEGTRRDEAIDWVETLVDEFPKSHFVVTTRPSAIDLSEVNKRFRVLELLPMSDGDVVYFATRWHQAVAEEGGGGEDLVEELEGHKRRFLTAIQADRHIRNLAVNPLLCAMLCALNVDFKGDLPKNKVELYEAALAMLLGRRDRGRGATGHTITLGERSQTALLQELAFWLIRQGLTTVELSRAEKVIGRTLRTLREVPDGGDDTVSAHVRHLLQRSGLLFEPEDGKLSFIHRSFQEYLAGKAAMENDEVELLLESSDDDHWRDTLIMAMGKANPRQSDQLMRGLLERARRSEDPKLSLLPIACLQICNQLDPNLEKEVEALAARLLPPKDNTSAEALAAVGDFVVDLLEDGDKLPQDVAEANATIRLLSIVPGQRSVDLMRQIAHRWQGLDAELMRAWRLFPRQWFGESVIRHASLRPEMNVSSEVLPYLEYLTTVEVIGIDTGDQYGFREVGTLPPNLRRVRVTRKPRMGLTNAAVFDGVRELEVRATHTSFDVTPVLDITSLEKLVIHVAQPISAKFDFRPLGQHPNLRAVEVVADGLVSMHVAGLGIQRSIELTVPEQATLIGLDNLGPRAVVTLS